MKKPGLLISLLLLCYSFSNAQTCENCGIGTNTPQSKLEIKGCGITPATSALNVTDSAKVSLLFVRDDKRIGIGTNNPLNTFSIGLTSQFQVDATGNLVKIKNITYDWPSANATTNGQVLTSTTGGVLSWTTPSGGSGWSMTGNPSTNSAINFLGTSDNVSLNFKTNNVQRIKIDSVGRVGIGTTSPAQKLQVAGNIDVQGLSNYYSFSNRNDLGLFGDGNYGLSLQAPEGISINIDANANGTNTPFQIRENGTGATGGRALLTVLESGNVGVGYNLPESKLQIRGSGTGSSSSALQVTDSIGAPIIFARNDKRIGIATSNPLNTFSIGLTSQFQVDATGNLVKIKNITYDWPSANATANGQVLTSTMGGTLTWATPSGSSGWSLTGNTATNSSANFLGTTDNVSLNIKTNNTRRIKIDSLGNVGIGTISPTALLHLAGGTVSFAPLKFISGTNLTTPQSGAMEFDGTSLTFSPSTTRYNLVLAGYGKAGGQAIIGGTALSDNLTLSSTSNATKGKILFGNSGYDEVNNRMGIGTVSPLSALSVGGIGNSLWKTYVYNSSTATGAIGIYGETSTNGGSGTGIYGTITAGNGYAYGIVGSSYIATPIEYGRAYGVKGQAGNSTSGYNYGVYGKLLGSKNGAGVYGADAASGDVGVPGSYAGFFAGMVRTTNDFPEKPTGGSWTGYSDKRLKKEILPFNDGLSVIRKINPINYKFNGIGGLPSTENHIGVAAQDVQDVVPYCIKYSKIRVNKDEANTLGGTKKFIGTDTTASGVVQEKYESDVLMYNQDGLFYVMLNSIKELDAKNTELVTNNTELTARLNKTEADLADLKKRFTLLEKK